MAPSVFINEIHYDNTGIDANEGIEIAGPAGTDLTGWSIALYNGTGGALYNTLALSGTIADQQNGFGTRFFSYPVNGIQNGSPDGIALVSGTAVEQFLSYEGSFTAVGGPANGLTSTDISVSETGSEPVGQSLQLEGTGNVYEDFTWSSPATSTYNAVNNGQTFTGSTTAGVTLTESGGSTDVNEAGSTTDTYEIALNTTPTGPVEIATIADQETQISSDGTNFFNSVTLTLTGTSSQTITVRAINDTDTEGSPHTGVITHTITSSEDPAYSSTLTPIPDLNVNVIDNEVTFTPIYEIQGSGAASPFADNGQSYTTEGVVVGDFQGSSGLNGFFIQDAAGDDKASTSDGIFVFAPGSAQVNVGDVVQITGKVSEFFNQTQISNLSNLTVLGSGAVTPIVVDLPVTTVDDLERYEGMSVTFPETLTVTENFNLARFGEVPLSANGRLFNPTNSIDPTDIPTSETENDENNVPAVSDQQNLNNLRRILLDDGSNTQNPTTIPFLREGNTLRVGDTTTNLTGVLGFGFGNYRIQPTVDPNFQATNPRTTAPDEVGGNVKVASFNVLNYFNGDGMGGGFPTPRGANSPAEFERQSAKIVSAIEAIDADVLGLIEVENDGDGPNSAIAELVDRLNTEVGAGTYDYIRDPATGVGTDEIKVSFIYKPGEVTPVGPALSDTDSIYSRLPVAQTFVLNSNGETFTPIINHFKSKSGTGTGLDADQGDGQGAFNFQRTQQATALLSFVNDLKTSTGDSDVLVIGDLNAYGEEDPIDVLRNGGLVDELGRFTQDPYSFVFDGQSGRLDHALTTSSLSSQVTGVAEWHINADEPRILDYNLEFKGPNQSPDLYKPTPYRSSDHDPVIVGLNASSSLTVINGSNRNDALNGTSGRDRINGSNGNDTLRGSNGNDILIGCNGSDTLLGQVSNDTLIGGNGTDLLDGGFSNDFLLGGRGRDTFVLAANNGTDAIQDFKNREDLIGLSGGLTFADLTIAQDTGTNRSDTLISLNDDSGTELLAILNRVRSSTITSADFVTV